MVPGCQLRNRTEKDLKLGKFEQFSDKSLFAGMGPINHLPSHSSGCNKSKIAHCIRHRKTHSLKFEKQTLTDLKIYKMSAIYILMGASLFYMSAFENPDEKGSYLNTFSANAYLSS